MDNNIQRNGDEAPKDRQAPPPVPIAKNATPVNAALKKEKRLNSSRFNISKNRELTPLLRLNGMCKHICIYKYYGFPFILIVKSLFFFLC